MPATVCDTSPAVQKLLKRLPGLRQELYTLLVAIKKDQDWKYFADSEGPAYIDVTVSCTFDFEEGAISWNYQTGDNSFTGGAYGHPEWFTTSLLSRSNCKDLAKDLIDEIEGRIHELHSFAN